jgi:hypothetical protein
LLAFVTTQCAKDCGPYNRACEYGHERLRGSQFLAHAVENTLDTLNPVVKVNFEETRDREFESRTNQDLTNTNTNISD